jgi:hypothetical protein
MILILAIGFVAIGSFLLQMFLPWWAIGIVPFLVGYAMSKKGRQAWWAGFLGIFLLWGIHALVLHLHTDGILSDKIAELFFLPSGLALVLVTALFGAIPAGLSGLAGFYLKRMRAARR